jgi:hypothetical protein
MCSLRRVLLLLVALVIAFALPAGGQALPPDVLAVAQVSAADLDCCHHAANVPCGNACPMGASIASALRTATAGCRAASVAARSSCALRSWARAPVTAPPKHSFV